MLMSNRFCFSIVIAGIQLDIFPAQKNAIGFLVRELVFLNVSLRNRKLQINPVFSNWASGIKKVLIMKTS